MSNPGLLKAYNVEGPLGKNRIVTHGATDGSVKQATAPTDPLLGVTEGFAYVAGDRATIVRSDIADIEYGGNITRGQPLTSDAVGRAVAAAPAVGTNVRIIGFADVSGVQGDICPVGIAPGLMQG